MSLKSYFSQTFLSRSSKRKFIPYPTCLTFHSGTYWEADARVLVDPVDTGCHVHTWITGAFVDICRCHKQNWGMYEGFCAADRPTNRPWPTATGRPTDRPTDRDQQTDRPTERKKEREKERKSFVSWKLCQCMLQHLHTILFQIQSLLPPRG